LNEKCITIEIKNSNKPVINEVLINCFLCNLIKKIAKVTPPKSIGSICVKEKDPLIVEFKKIERQ